VTRFRLLSHFDPVVDSHRLGWVSAALIRQVPRRSSLATNGAQYRIADGDRAPLGVECLTLTRRGREWA